MRVDTLAVALLVGGAVLLSVTRPQFESDTISLAIGVDNALICLDAGTRPCPGVGAYSLQQTAIVAAAKTLGLAPVTIGRLLAALSGLSFAVIVLFFAAARTSSLRRLSLAALAAGPLVYYVRSTFGGMLATAALVGFIAAIRANRAHGWLGLVVIAAMAAMASLGKDTLPAFVLMLGVTAIALEWKGWAHDRMRLAAVAAGALAGAAAFAAFHQFRVGAWVNTEYLERSELFLNDFGDVTSAFLGHWFSPSAGLLWFWPLSVLVFVKSWPRSALPLAVVVAYALGLSFWWSPYGWIAWGDRLLYPLVCAAMFACVGSAGGQGLMASGVGRTTPVLAIALVSAAATCAVTADSTALTTFFAATDDFPGPPTIQANVDLYRDFLRHLTWERRLDAVAVFAPLATPLGAAIASVAGLASVLFLRARDRRDSGRVY